jgi:hypothetical protein
MTKHRASPAWFTSAKYDYLRALDAAGWLKELERCAHLVHRAKMREDGEPFEKEWGGIIGEEIAAGYVPQFIGPPPVEVVDKADQANFATIEQPMLIVQVWLGATDADIIAGFEKELRKARKEHPSILKKPGPQALSARFGQAEFDRWRRHRIVEVIELIDWASRRGEKITKADLGRWLFADEDDPEGGASNPNKAAHIAVKALEDALASIPALRTQVAATGR